jgi:hypothetical protein
MGGVKMEKITTEETLKKISDDLNEAMRVSSKIFAVDRIFISVDAGDDVTITSEAADGIHIILDEVAAQISEYLSNALERVNKLQKAEVTV